MITKFLNKSILNSMHYEFLSRNSIILFNLDSTNEFFIDCKNSILFYPYNSVDITNRIKLLSERIIFTLRISDNANNFSENY